MDSNHHRVTVNARIAGTEHNTTHNNKQNIEPVKKIFVHVAVAEMIKNNLDYRHSSNTIDCRFGLFV